MSPGDILVLGDLMRDVVVRLGGPIRRGSDQHATIATTPGGSAANLAVWLAGEGAPVRLLAAVGEADASTERERLAQAGVTPLLVAHPVLATGTLIALVDPDGERSFLTDRGANDDLVLADLSSDPLEGVTHLHVSGYAFVGVGTRAAARHLIAEGRRRAIPVSIDPGSAGFIADLGAEAVLDWCAGASLFVANADEAAALTGCQEPDHQLEALGARFPEVVLKRGALGALARDAGGRRHAQPAPCIAVRDTIGAGDAFLSGFLAARRAGEPIGACLALAVARGSFAATLSGGLPPVS